jgi:hypothetical protein
MFSEESYPALVNCVFSGNAAANFGGGISSIHSDSTLFNCTFSGNSSASGGGLYNWNSEATIANCILWGDSPDELVDATGSHSAIRYTAIQGGWPGDGNIDANPLFLNPVAGDYRLTVCSPCIDAGDNEALSLDAIAMLDRNPRFLDDLGMPDDGLGTPPLIDMGAYEFQGETCYGDIDGDHDVDATDLASLLAHYGEIGTVYTNGDLNRDEEVDSSDLAALLAVYRAACDPQRLIGKDLDESETCWSSDPRAARQHDPSGL